MSPHKVFLLFFLFFYTSMFFSFLSSCFNVFFPLLFIFSAEVVFSSLFHSHLNGFSHQFSFLFSYLHYTTIHSLTTFLPCYSLPSSAAFSFPFHASSHQPDPNALRHQSTPQLHLPVACALPAAFQ